MTEPRKPGRPATGKTPVRSMRLGDVYDKAKTEAELHGESITGVVERLLAQYLDEKDRTVSDTGNCYCGPGAIRHDFGDGKYCKARARVRDFLRATAMPPHKLHAGVRDFLRATAMPPHKLHADQFEEAEAVAAGAMIGARMAGKDIPPWTEDAIEAFRAAAAEAFDAGFRAGQEATR